MGWAAVRKGRTPVQVAERVCEMNDIDFVRHHRAESISMMSEMPELPRREEQEPTHARVTVFEVVTLDACRRI